MNLKFFDFKSINLKFKSKSKLKFSNATFGEYTLLCKETLHFLGVETKSSDHVLPN